MKKIILSIMTLVTSTTVWCQQLTDEDREKLKPYHYQTRAVLTFVPGYIDFGGQNLNFGIGANLDGFIGKIASFSAGMTTAAYGDQKHGNATDPLMSDSYQSMNKTGTSFLNVNFHLLDKIAIGKIKVEKFRGQRTDYSSGTQTTYYDVYKRKGPVRKIIALRGGIYGWNSVINPETSDQWNMVQSNGTVVQANDRTFTNLSTTNFSVGVQFAKFVANTEMGGGGIVSYFRNFYVDLLINSSTTLDNNVDKLGNTYVYQFDTGTLKKSSMGWRVGWKFMGLGRKYWTGGYYMEAGVRPGVEGRGAFLQMGLLLGLRYPFVPLK